MGWLARLGFNRWQQIAFWAIVLLSFLLRMWMIEANPNKPITIYDDRYYIDSAKRLLEAGIFTFGHDKDLPTVFIPPLFPLFLAGIFAIFGSDESGINIAQYILALLGTFSTALLMILAAKLKRPGAGLIGAVVYAAYPPTILSSIVFLTETPFTFISLLFFLFLVRAIESHSMRDFFIAGLILGLATLTRPTIALFPAVVGLYLWGRRDYGFGKAFKVGTVLVATLFLVLSPWIIRNYIHFEQFIPLTKASGNPFITGTYIDNDVFKDGVSEEFPWLPKGWKAVPGNQIATNDSLMEQGKQRLKEEFQKDPKAMIKWYTIGKFRKFWGQPFDWRETLQKHYDKIIPLHKALLAISFVGLLFAFWRRVPYTPLLAMYFAYLCGLQMVYVTLPRYALPLLPLVFFFLGILLTGPWKRKSEEEKVA